MQMYLACVLINTLIAIKQIEEYNLALTQCALEWTLLCRRRKKRMDLEMLSCKRRHLSLDLDHLRCYSSSIQI